ncbi:MAG: AAA family ATPase [Agathobacter sp.]|nr:AAA family ATPase [Agathobacter sp.]
MKQIKDEWYESVNTHRLFDNVHPPSNESDFDYDIPDVCHYIEDKTFDDIRSIASFLQERTKFQDDACVSLAKFAWNHAHGRPQHLMLIGPTGCGKSHLVQTLEEYDPRLKVIVINSEHITPSGFSGPSVLTSIYNHVENGEKNVIIVFDEVDKLIRNKGHDCSFSEVTQSELLSITSYPYDKPFRINPPSSNGSQPTKTVYPGTFSWILCGCFDYVASDISEKADKKFIGFGSEKTNAQSMENLYKKINIKELCKAGLIRELAGRFSNIVSLNQFSSDAFYKLISDTSPNSLIAQLADSYNMSVNTIRKRIIKNNMLHDIAEECQKQKLGVRYAKTLIANEIDEFIYKHMDEYNQGLF